MPVQLFVEGHRTRWCGSGLGEHPEDIVLDSSSELLKASPAHGWLLGKSFGQILEAERRATRALARSRITGHRYEVGRVDAAALGALFVLLKPPRNCGIAMDINPFDQPGVEAGKVMALGLLGREDCLEHAKRVLTAEGVV